MKRKTAFRFLATEGIFTWVPWYGQYLYLSRARIECLRQLLSEYNGLSDDIRQTLPSEEAKTISEVEMLLSSSPDCTRWDDVYVLEKALALLYPEDRLRRHVWSVRATYREVAGSDAYQSYLESKPPDPVGAENGAVRADVLQLLSNLHRYHSLRRVVERERNHLALRLATVTVALCIAIVIYYGLVSAGSASNVKEATAAHGTSGTSASVVGILAAGALGGLMSAQQRLHRTRFNESPASRLLTLSQSWYTVYYAPVMGALCAAILTLLFSSHMIQGELFPQLATSDVRAPLGAALTDLNGVNLAKLLMWSFIAGFAERLVPDTLDRLTARVHSDEQIESKTL